MISDEALRARLATRGMPPAVTGIALGLYAASRAGEFAVVDPTLERLLGRRLTTMRDLIAGHQAVPESGDTFAHHQPRR